MGKARIELTECLDSFAIGLFVARKLGFSFIQPSDDIRVFADVETHNLRKNNENFNFEYLPLDRGKYKAASSSFRLWVYCFSFPGKIAVKTL